MKKTIMLLLGSLVSVSFVMGQAPATAPSPVSKVTTTLVEAKGTPVSASARVNKAGQDPPLAMTPALRLATATAERARPLNIARFGKSPVINGQLDDEAWRGATVLKDFFQTQPGDNTEPSRPTEVLLGYDAKFLYIAFRAIDEPANVRATVAKRDSIFDDDYVGIYLDTFNDQRRAYALFFNPLGVQGDGILTEGLGEDYSVDILMQSKGVINEKGYTVEVAIPFKSLRYEAGKGKFWGVHFIRRIKRFNNENDSWMPLSRDKSGLLNQAGLLTGFDEIGRTRGLELIPSLTLSETGRRVSALPVPSLPGLNDPGRLVNQPVKFEPGLTGKINITPQLTLDFALNPDFAQVEADQLVVTANQRFPIFFEEKRPFFLEGIDIFQTRLNVVHTRTIIDPNVAVKLSGKQGRNTFGILVASDNAPGNFTDEERLDPGNAPFLDKNAFIFVGRLKHDIGRESSLGLIVTSYNFKQHTNHLGGVDGRFRLNPTTVFDFQVLGTTSHQNFFDPDLGEVVYRTGNALGYSFQFDRSNRHLNINIRGEGRTRFYVADVGFTQRVNTNFERAFIRYASEPKPKARLVSWYVSNSIPVNFDWQGRIQNWNEEAKVGFNFQRQTTLNVGFNGGYERLFEEEFGPKRKPAIGGAPARQGTFFGEDSERSTRKKTVFLTLASTPSKKYLGSIFIAQTWGAFDFDFGAGHRYPRVSPAALLDPGAPLDPGPGKSLQVQAYFAFQPTNTLRSSIDYTKVRLVRNDTERTAFDVNLVSWRTTYQFSRDTFLRTRLDYSTLPGNLSAQFLLGWTPSPGTSFFVGYNDDLNHGELSPFTSQLEPGFHRNGRTFFIKMSYLFRRTF